MALTTRATHVLFQARIIFYFEMGISCSQKGSQQKGLPSQPSRPNTSTKEAQTVYIAEGHKQDEAFEEEQYDVKFPSGDVGKVLDNPKDEIHTTEIEPRRMFSPTLISEDTYDLSVDGTSDNVQEASWEADSTFTVSRGSSSLWASPQDTASRCSTSDFYATSSRLAGRSPTWYEAQLMADYPLWGDTWPRPVPLTATQGTMFPSRRSDEGRHMYLEPGDRARPGVLSHTEEGPVQSTSSNGTRSPASGEEKRSAQVTSPNNTVTPDPSDELRHCRASQGSNSPARGY